MDWQRTRKSKAVEGDKRGQLSREEERAEILDAQAGDRDAMERIVLQYQPLVRAAGCGRAVQSFAEDATAAAAEELVRSVLAFDVTRGVPFAAFARPRVYGAVSHLLRHTTRRWEHECSPGEAESLECVADAGTSDASEARLLLAPLLEKLSRDERRVLHLLYVRGLTTYEAATALGISQSKVMRTKRRAIERMREGTSGV